MTNIQLGQALDKASKANNVERLSLDRLIFILLGFLMETAAIPLIFAPGNLPTTSANPKDMAYFY